MSIMVWGHRGYQHHRQPQKYASPAYQNSIEAFDFAFSKVMGLETDVIQSKEKTVYLAHDTVFLDRVNYELKSHLDGASQQLLQDRFIFQLSDNEAKRLKLKDGQSLPTLEDVLQLLAKYPGRFLNLELKGPDTFHGALRTVEQAIDKKIVAEEQILFSSFNLPELALARKEQGDRFRIGALFSMKTQTKNRLFPDWPGATQDAYYTPFRPEEVLELDVVKAIDPDYFHLERNSVTRDDIAAIEKHYPKALISLWCVGENHPDDNPDFINIIENLAPTGKIYAVMSDFPEAVQEHCLRRGLDIKTPQR